MKTNLKQVAVNMIECGYLSESLWRREVGEVGI